MAAVIKEQRTAMLQQQKQRLKASEVQLSAVQRDRQQQDQQWHSSSGGFRLMVQVLYSGLLSGVTHWFANFLILSFSVQLLGWAVWMQSENRISELDEIFGDMVSRDKSHPDPVD